MVASVASCSTCRLAAKEDGGDGHCTRTESYPRLRELTVHDCPLYRRRPTPRAPRVTPPEQKGLF